LTVLVTLALACAGADSDGELPVAQCGMAAYTLLPREEVGQVVSWEEMTEFDIDPRTIDGVLPLYDLQKMAPVPYGVRTFRFRYTTQDRGKKVEATAILGVPDDVPDPAPSFPVALFLHGTTGFSDPCSPSRGVIGPFEGAIFASNGFVAIAPDFIGMNGEGARSTTPHGYLVAEQTAIGSWDALRAGMALLDGDLKDVVRVSGDLLIWGGSQGGHGALFTELYGPYYAPEFTPRAVLASLVPSTLRPLGALAFSQPGPTTISFAAFLTSQRAWYGSPKDLNGELTDAAPYFLASRAESYVYPQDACSVADVVPVEDLQTLPLTTFYQAGFIEKVKADRWEDLPPWDCFLRTNTVAESPVKPRRFLPTFMVYSEKDEMVNTPIQELDYDRLCGLGWQLDFLSCKNAGHADGGMWSLAEQMDWARARLRGEPIPANRLCQRRSAQCCAATPDGRCP
jgi:hypothetical protein